MRLVKWIFIAKSICYIYIQALLVFYYFKYILSLSLKSLLIEFFFIKHVPFDIFKDIREDIESFVDQHHNIQNANNQKLYNKIKNCSFCHLETIQLLFPFRESLYNKIHPIIQKHKLSRIQ